MSIQIISHYEQVELETSLIDDTLAPSKGNEEICRLRRKTGLINQRTNGIASLFFYFSKSFRLLGIYKIFTLILQLM